MSQVGQHGLGMATAHFGLFTSEAALCGLLPVSWFVLRPALAVTNDRSRRAVDAVERRLSLGVDACLAAAVLSTVTLMGLQVQTVADVRGERAGVDTLRRVLLTHVGQWSLLRLGVLLALGLVLHGRVRHHLLSADRRRPSTEWWCAWAALTTALLLTVSMTGHAAAAGPVGVVADTLHLAAGGSWLTGIAVLAVLLPRSLGALRPAEREAAFAQAVGAFSRLALCAIPVLALTGIVSGMTDLRSLRDLRLTPYGHLLGIKLWLFVWVLAFGGYNHFRLRKRLAGPSGSAAVAAAAHSLAITAAGELAFGLLVVAATAQLVGMSAPS